MGAGRADDRSDLGFKAMPVGMRQIGTTGKQLFFPEPIRIQQKDQNPADAGRAEKRVAADGVP